MTMAGSPQIAAVRLPGAISIRTGEPSDCTPIDPARPDFAASRVIQGAAFDQLIASYGAMTSYIANGR
ncbi:hypothetical protein [Burkholderia aenigmatica]|uniref:hypothetical protein n=1 Tax=Burkholderia aenigmatica TaxID=2015348 RepID=UPI00264AA43E|nr:hypothetical protein [Burkholderia aenigmatica]MDN7879004.1 hypothetical protein [Burkholderia aenigmatica]